MFVVEFEDALKSSLKNRNRIRVRPPRKKISPTSTSSRLTESSYSSSGKVPSSADQLKCSSSSSTYRGGPNDLGLFQDDDDDDENVPAYVDVHGKVGDSDDEGDSDGNSSSSD